MTLMLFMVEIGRSKFGQNNRISLVEGLPELLNLSVGDYVVFSIESGKLVLEKETKKYRGWDFEGEEIREKLIELEDSMIDDIIDGNIDPDELERIAREEYLRDKAERERDKNGR